MCVRQNPQAMTDESKIVDLSGDGGVIKEIYQEGAGEVPPIGYEVSGRRILAACLSVRSDF